MNRRLLCDDIRPGVSAASGGGSGGLGGGAVGDVEDARLDALAKEQREPPPPPPPLAPSSPPHSSRMLYTQSGAFTLDDRLAEDVREDGRLWEDGETEALVAQGRGSPPQWELECSHESCRMRDMPDVEHVRSPLPLSLSLALSLSLLLSLSLSLSLSFSLFLSLSFFLSLSLSLSLRYTARHSIKGLVQ